MKRNTTKKTIGFTLVELLTAMAVIGILLALLIPALAAVQKNALIVKQKAQFHTIGLGLETFRNDSPTGDYPPSAYSVNTGYYTPSQSLAEAMVGRDGLGFHPQSVFNETGQSGSGPLYRNDPAFSTLTPAQQQANLSARLGPYLELESANAVQLQSIYGSRLDTLSPDTFVLVDMFSKVKHLGTGKQIGMPILYYRADTTKPDYYDPTKTYDPTTYTYNVLDSLAVVNGTTLKGIASQVVPFIKGSSSHPLKAAAGQAVFYSATSNPNFTNPTRPYRSTSFLLHSAGPDGLYGTTDDVFNFDDK